MRVRPPEPGDVGGSPGASAAGALEHVTGFGPYDLLAEWAHRLYLDGFGERAITAAREGLAFCEAAGDERTARYLQFIAGVALHQLGRAAEASEEAGHLLDRLGTGADPVWRAKALALLAEARVDLGQTALAMDHLAEGRMIVSAQPLRTYDQLSATMSVALALRALALFEPADELMRQMLAATFPPPRVQLNVAQEAAVLQVSWGAMLEVSGRPDEARGHYTAAGSVIARMRALALEAGYPEMLARAEALEGFVAQRGGEDVLAEARLRPAMAGFRLREELVETQVARVGLALAVAARGGHAEARDLLAAVRRASSTTQLDVWGMTAMAAEARTAVLEHGDHPGVEALRTLSRIALARLWEDRESRFETLRDRVRQREMAEQHARLGRASLVDPLTGLGNRRRLQQVLERPDRRFSAVLLDVDGFTAVNDEHSHETGDAVLRAVGALVADAAGETGVVVRYGGDEFALLLPAGPGGGPDPLVVAENLLDGVRKAPWIDLAVGLRVTASAGVAGPAPAAEALRDADLACTAAKRAGRDRVHVA